MVKFRTVIDSAKLREVTHFRAVLYNKDSCLSYFQILTRYLRVKPFFRGLGVKKITQLLISERN